jgi:hypothetical protein
LLRRFAVRNDDGRHVPRNDDPDVIASEPLVIASGAKQSSVKTFSVWIASPLRASQ